jgi:PAS domain-containing protein
MDYFWFLLGAGFLMLVVAICMCHFGYQAKLKAVQLEHQAAVDALKTLFMNVPGAVMSLEKDLSIIDVNPVLCKVTGLQLSAIKGKKCYEVL